MNILYNQQDLEKLPCPALKAEDVPQAGYPSYESIPSHIRRECIDCQLRETRVDTGTLLAILIYHEEKAKIAEVYGRLLPDDDTRREWQEERNRHLIFAETIRKVKANVKEK